MTWGKAALPLTIVVVLWLLRVMFEMFWFFGPALLAVGCTVGVNSVVDTSTASAAGKVVATACTGVSAIIGFFGIEIIEPLGIVMAMAVGFISWLLVGFIMLLSNQRVFKEEPLAGVWLTGGLIVNEIPLIGTLPGLTTAVWRIYHKQIKRDRKKLKEYEAAVAAQKTQERQMQIDQFMEVRQAQINQQQEAEEAYREEEEVAAAEEAEIEAVNDAEYTQEFDEAA